MSTGAASIGRRSRAKSAAKAQRRPLFSPFSAIVLATGAGLLLCSVANALSRAADPAIGLYWLGLLLIALPIFYRLTSKEASTRERLMLVVLLGLGLYLVKVMRDSPVFTFSDEQVHAFNALRIDQTDALFKQNPILEVTPYYPGLEAATTALMKLTGLSVYPAGIILAGVARLVMLASLFLLFERVAGSARAAGLGVAIYAGNFNFLFWSAQYSYESLALPLLLLTMMALAEREVAPKAALRAWGVPVLLAIAAIVVTHHLTSYATVGFLVALTIAYWFVQRSWRPPNPWPFAVAAATMAGLWLIVVASSTVGYLTPVLRSAFDAIGSTIGGEDEPRALFEGSGPTVEPTPLVGKAIAVLAVLLLAAALPFGLREIYRRHMKKPFALIFAIAAVFFFGTLALRLAPLAWETGNRLSEFLFVGLAFTLSCAFAAALSRFRDQLHWRLAAATAIALIFIGGAISGWPWDSQLAKPMRISADGRTLPSPSLSAAEWSRDHIEGGRFAATNAGAGLLLVPGEKVAMAGSKPAIEDVLDAESFEGWELPLLRRYKLRYVVADRREASADTLRGHFFDTEEPNSETWKEPSTTAKFNQVPGVSRLYSNGAITIFDLEGKP